MLLAVSICTLAFAATSLGIIAALLGRNTAGTRDFVQYWGAGKQLLHHSDPYNATALLPIERAVGYPPGMKAAIMANPPTALPLVAPLGLVGAKSGHLLWFVLSLICLIASVRIIWTLHGRPVEHLRWLGYSFAPVLSCLLSGQVTLFILFGLALFLRFHRTKPFIAGLSLWFCLLKPHLFLPFGIVLLAWIVTTRSYRILTGALSSLVISGALAFLLDQSAWTQYIAMMRSARIDKIFIPCLSIVLRQHLGHALWPQYLPAVAGCLWATIYFKRHQAEWNWIEHGSLLMLVSVLVAPYTWIMDQAILLPAMLHAAYSTQSKTHIAILALASAIIEIEILAGIPLLTSALYLWTAPAWLLWYALATRKPLRGKLAYQTT
ncbi:MAG TPA: glycosyltransferase family 87 protein [Edaphobacter sp.]|nr:glycosyltransferase family 87 protein [Edaphobacter sp.]